MGIIDWLKTPEGAFVIALPIGYFGGKWLEGKITDYLQKNREVMRENIKQAIREGLSGNPEPTYSLITKEIQKLENKLENLILSQYQELSSRISKLEKYKKE
ncbi:MAG: hypothetical protein QXQ69_03170 [Candidatus Aenigmatarchaeota archaeon]